MKQKATFLSLAIMGILFLVLLGISIAEHSLFGIIGSIIGHILVMGIGFRLKRKWANG